MSKKQTNDNLSPDYVRFPYPSLETIVLRDNDIIIVKTRAGERRIPSNKWWINTNTPVGEDADLWERKPWEGRRRIPWGDVIAVERLAKK